MCFLASCLPKRPLTSGMGCAATLSYLCYTTFLSHRTRLSSFSIPLGWKGSLNSYSQFFFFFFLIENDRRVAACYFSLGGCGPALFGDVLL